MAGAKYELERLEEAIREAARGVIEYETDDPFTIVRLLRLKALGNTVEIGERQPVSRATWDKGVDY